LSANGETLAIWGAAIAGIASSFLQTVMLFILKDFRERIMRIEDRFMRRRHGNG